MVDYFKDFLLNIFIIFSPLVFYPYIHTTKNRPVLFRFLIFIFFAFALAVTMSFPVSLNGIIYDFRSIPLAVGSLYGGVQVSVLLYLTLTVIRYLMGNPSQLHYMLAILPSFFVVLLAIRKYPFLRLHQKILLSVAVCSLIKALTFSFYLLSTGQLELLLSRPLPTLETYMVQGFIVGLYVYMIEFLNNYFYMREEVVKSEKVKIVSDMAASVAHEIRNPLTTVRGFIQLFGTANLDKEKTAYYQQICIEELDRAQSIITDYLSLAKPDPEVIEQINIHDEIGYLSNILLTYANYNNIQISVSLKDESPPHVFGDRYKFRQALINIGKNAIEAMHNGGQLELGVYRQDKLIAVTVRDTGIGMTAEQINRLGTPYYSTKEKGTGLGTMVSFSILKKMNGKIEIHSEIGKGTKYTLLLPVCEA